MTINVWFTNTKTQEMEETLNFLSSQGASNITVTHGENGPEYRCLMYVDSEGDMQKALRVMLYYNDRSVQSLKEFRALFPPVDTRAL